MTTEVINSFKRIWAENTTIKEWRDEQYKTGWATIADVSPSLRQFDAIHYEQDLKNKWIFQQIQSVATARGVTLVDATSTVLLDALNEVGMSTAYNPTKRYLPGEMVFICDDPASPYVGNWYEAYHPDGCLGKDPRDPVNRRDGWTNTDPAAPYYWLKHGKWLEFATIGSPVPIQRATVSSQLYIKYRNDGNLHKDKFWRLAAVYPDLITNNIITLADLRGEFIRGLDDARGVDSGRVVGSFQKATLGTWDDGNEINALVMKGATREDIGGDSFTLAELNALYPNRHHGGVNNTSWDYYMNNVLYWYGMRSRNIAFLQQVRF